MSETSFCSRCMKSISLQYYIIVSHPCLMPIFITSDSERFKSFKTEVVVKNLCYSYLVQTRTWITWNLFELKWSVLVSSVCIQARKHLHELKWHISRFQFLLFALLYVTLNLWHVTAKLVSDHCFHRSTVAASNCNVLFSNLSLITQYPRL